MESKFTNYTAFLKNLEELCSKIYVHYSSDINCEHKCSSCCISGLTLLPVEADYIRDSIKEMNIVPNKKNKCFFLNDNSCQIYQFRPVVCRTQGFPLIYRDDEKKEIHISNCELNFKSTKEPIKIDGNYVIDMDKINMVLSAINIEYTEKLKQKNDKRTPIEQLIIKRN
ncbi:MAG: YkgJ family cysteine cluster protein [bacterium]